MQEKTEISREFGLATSEVSMSVLLSIFFWLLAIVGILILMVLMLPISFWAKGNLSSMQIAGIAGLSWGFGLLSVRASSTKGVHLCIFGVRIYRIKSTEEDKKKKKEPKPKKPKEKPSIRWFISQREKSYEIFGKLLKALHLNGYLRGVIGFDDPGDTAYVYMLVASTGLGREIKCNFMDEIIDLEAKVYGRLWPIQLLWYLMIFIIRPDTRIIITALTK
jgi:hypothetical protein